MVLQTAHRSLLTMLAIALTCVAVQATPQASPLQVGLTAQLPSLTTIVNSNGGPPVFRTATNITNKSADSLTSFRKVSAGTQQFALELLTTFSDVIEDSQRTANGHDFMISPFAIWSLLLLLAEGAQGNTFNELSNSLHFGNDLTAVRQAYREVKRFLNLNTSTIEVGSLQAMFTDINQPPHRDYESTVERDYSSKLIPVDFSRPIDATNTINTEVREATRGLIQHTVLPQDLKDANLFLLSSLFFRGQWKNPFEPAKTQNEPFYNEAGKPIGNVDMMFQELHAYYATMKELDASVLELPYGNENRLSMLIIQPRKGVPMRRVFHNLKTFGIEEIFARLESFSADYDDEMVEVFLPKFDTASDLSIRSILENLGMKDVFSPSRANLTNISANLFVSNVIHTTKIIVNEEGTTAAAITSAVLIDKSRPTTFLLNRPFIYLIVEKSTNLLLFAGQLKNPNRV